MLFTLVGTYYSTYRSVLPLFLGLFGGRIPPSSKHKSRGQKMYEVAKPGILSNSFVPPSIIFVNVKIAQTHFNNFGCIPTSILRLKSPLLGTPKFV